MKNDTENTFIHPVAPETSRRRNTYIAQPAKEGEKEEEEYEEERDKEQTEGKGRRRGKRAIRSRWWGNMSGGKEGEGYEQMAVKIA